MFFFQELFENPFLFCAQMLVVVFSISVHEFFHAWIALREGDPTAAEHGHLTLNPIRQMGIFSLIMLFLCGISWGQVPVNPRRLRTRNSMLRVALAGPVANLGLTVIAIIILAVSDRWELLPQAGITVFFLLGVMNLVLAVFNLLPVPGLDGWTAFALLFPRLFLLKQEVRNGVAFALVLLVFVMMPTFFNWAYYAVGVGATQLRMLLG